VNKPWLIVLKDPRTGGLRHVELGTRHFAKACRFVEALSELTKCAARWMLEALAEGWTGLVLFLLLLIVAFTMESR